MPTPPEPLFTTRRLRARRWRDSDLGPLLRVYGDLDAMRWVGDGAALTPDDASRWLEVTYANYAARGYGMYALESAATGEVIGFMGIVHPGGQAEPEVKYALAREQWGAGLATEALMALLEYASAVLGLTHLIATTAPENAASHRVLLKCGFERGELREDEDGSIAQVFEWRAGAEAVRTG